MTPTPSLDATLDALYADALRFMVEDLGAERAAVLRDGGEEDMEVKAVHDLDAETFWTDAPVSLTVIRKVRAEGVPVFSSDAQEDPDFERSWSLDVSQVHSVICAPFWGPDGEIAGVLYADCLALNRAFTKPDFQHLMTYARDLEHRLARLELRQPDPGRRATRKMKRPTPVMQPVATGVPREPQTRRIDRATEILRREAPAWRREVETWWRALAHQGVRRVELTVFFRSMATLFECGVSLPRSVDLLARQCSYPPMRVALQAVLKDLLKGSTLSGALAKHPELFSPLQARLVAVGEQGGSLGTILERLAVQAERSGHVQSQMKSALSYPLMVLGATLVLVGWAHGVIFQGLQGLLGSMGAEVPLPTQVLMLVGGVVSRPWAVALLVLLAGGALWWARRQARKPEGQRVLHGAALRVPGVGPALKAAEASEYCRALALCVSSGLPLLRAMELAEGVLRNVTLLDGAEQARRSVAEGRLIHKSLSSTEFLPRMALQMVAAGEESGHLEEMLERVARMQDDLVERSVEMATAALQPLLLLFVGLLVGFVVVATMAPMLKVVETL